MNERIKLLAEQAGYKHPAAVGTCEDYAYFDYEKFAELMLEDFRNVLADVYRQVPLECCGHFLYADEVLAKHFYGVKE